MKTVSGFTVPSRFKAIAWFNVGKGDVVYLVGTHLGEPRAYGPYIVHSVGRRFLENSQGNVFMHYAEDLLVKEEGENATKD